MRLMKCNHMLFPISTLARPLSVAVIGMALALTACGGDDGGGGGGGSYGAPLEATPAEKQVAVSAVDSVQDLTALATTDVANESALGSVSGSYGTMNALVGVKLSKDPGAAAGGAGSNFGFLSQAQGALDAGCYSTDGATTTYTGCDTGGFSITGTITTGESQVSIDLTLTGSGTVGGLNSFAFTQVGSISFSETAITGELKYDTDVDIDGAGGTSGSFSTKTAVRAIYDIQLTAGCATGGTLEVNQKTTADLSGLEGVPASAANSGSTDVWVKAEFGPNCGDVTLY